jgi:hypothetical protein
MGESEEGVLSEASFVRWGSEIEKDSKTWTYKSVHCTEDSRSSRVTRPYVLIPTLVTRTRTFDFSPTSLRIRRYSSVSLFSRRWYTITVKRENATLTRSPIACPQNVRDLAG